MQTEATRLPVTRRSPGTGVTGHRVSSRGLGMGWCDPAQPGACRAVLGARARLEHTLRDRVPAVPNLLLRLGPRRGPCGELILGTSLRPCPLGGVGRGLGRAEAPPEAAPARAVAWSKCPGACGERERGASRGR